MPRATFQELVDFFEFGRIPPNRLSKSERQVFKRTANGYEFDETTKKLYKKGSPRRLCVPVDERQAVLHRHHAEVGTHWGVRPTYEAIKKNHYWEGMEADVKAFVKSCDRCQKNGPFLREGQELRPIKVTSKFSTIGTGLHWPI